MSNSVLGYYHPACYVKSSPFYSCFCLVMSKKPKCLKRSCHLKSTTEQHSISVSYTGFRWTTKKQLCQIPASLQDYITCPSTLVAMAKNPPPHTHRFNSGVAEGKINSNTFIWAFGKPSAISVITHEIWHARSFLQAEYSVDYYKPAESSESTGGYNSF